MSDPGDSVDGRFDLYYQHGWVRLAVHPPGKGGRPVYHEEILGRMGLLGMPRVATRDVKRIVDAATGVAEPLVEWPEGAQLESQVGVVVSEDGMTAWIEVNPPRRGAATPTADDLLGALERHGVVHGIDRAALQAAAAAPRYGERVVAATGTRPVHATGGEVRYHFNTDRGKPYLVMAFDRINLRELSFIENRAEGDLLVELLPPLAPRDGRTVTGSEVRAETAAVPVVVRAGKNTALTSDGRIVATASGNVRVHRGAVIVEPVVTVERVGYATGNIHCDGSVVVEQDVADGFVVEATGDIQVGRAVGRATLIAGGNVLLKTGINGNGRGQVRCEGDLLARFIESATVVCHGTVFVEEAIMHSHVSAWRHCLLGGRRAEVIASELIVGGHLWCRKLGGITEAPTVAAVGVAPDLLAAFREARRELDEATDRHERITAELGRLNRPAAAEGSSDQADEARARLQAEAIELSSRLPELRRALSERRNALQASEKCTVVVEDTIYRGVTILFGRLEYHPPDGGARRTILRRGGAGIVETGFNPGRPPTLDLGEYPEAAPWAT